MTYWDRLWEEWLNPLIELEQNVNTLIAFNQVARETPLIELEQNVNVSNNPEQWKVDNL